MPEFQGLSHKILAYADESLRLRVEEQGQREKIRMKYAVCSGSWWSPLQNHPGTKFNDSWDFVRDVRFFSVWHYFVNKYTCPEKILIVDSDSPLKPEFPEIPVSNLFV